MDDKLARHWYLTRPEAISRYLASVIRNWGYQVYWNPSDDSESRYLKVYLGTRESPKSFHIRISDHSVPPKKLWVVFDIDVYCEYEREGATSYVKLLSKLAEELGRSLPPALEKLKAGTAPYKNYRVEMQRRKKLANSRRHFFRAERVYV